MTPQDLLIAKTLAYSRDTFDDFYEFTMEVYPKLVGHPYVFLENTVDTPVEFVAAQPIIKVSKSRKGYTFSTDM
jgi:hypothetical protein